MQIGIIGAGHIGGTLASQLVRLGHDVTIANSRGPETLTALAADSGARAVTVAQAAQAADVIVLAIPQKNVAQLPTDLLARTAARTVVIDTGNYYPEVRDGRIEEIEAGLLESEWVAKQIGRPVVKAFNNIAQRSLRDGGKPAGTPGRIALSIAGDQAEAKAVVLRLIDQLGFDGVDIGPLAESWRQQPATPAYCHDLDVGRLKQALAAAERSRSAEYRREADAMARRILAGEPR